MRVSCVLVAQGLELKPADLIVFPEGVCLEEIEQAERSNPDAIIVGAITEENHSRGVLLHRGQNRINYLKVETDGRTIGTGNQQQTPIYEFGSACIGVIICMDIDHVGFSSTVIENMRSSSASSKFLCIPADMGSHWFTCDSLPTRFNGIRLILCNHVKTHQARCKSFITDTSGRKLVTQLDIEPIYAILS